MGPTAARLSTRPSSRAGGTGTAEGRPRALCAAFRCQRSERYRQRFPSLALETCRRWSEDAPAGRAWTSRHALRGLVKAGNGEAIRILGGEESPRVRVQNAVISLPRVAMGEAVRLSFEVESMARGPQRLLIDYAVHYVKANGSTRPKVFKLRTFTRQPGEKAVLSATVSLASMTTRRHYPGHHRIDVVINGTAHSLGKFELTA